jgi:hypothetical protein
VLAACGSDHAATPMAPTPPPTTPITSNHAPQIVAAHVTPSFGITGMTTFTAHVDAHDDDSDTLTYNWSTSQRSVLGVNAPDYTFVAGSDDTNPLLGVPELSVSVTDGKGSAVTQKLAGYVTADLAGNFDGVFGPNSTGGDTFALTLKRTDTTVTGTFLTFGGEHHDVSIRGETDPADPGRLDAAGRFHLRFKIPGVDDLVLDGQLQPKPSTVTAFLSWYYATGIAHGGGHENQPFMIGIHDPY